MLEQCKQIFGAAGDEDGHSSTEHIRTSNPRRATRIDRQLHRDLRIEEEDNIFGKHKSNS